MLQMKKWRLNEPDSPPKISVVVAVYNKAKEFEMCVEGYRRQSFQTNEKKPFELIIADDGSSKEIEQLSKQFAGQTRIPTTYLFQNDAGWGKLRMLNWAALEARADRIVFTDGDCVPHRHFVKCHHENIKENNVLCGRRVDLMEEVSKTLTLRDIRDGILESPFWIAREILRKRVDFGEQGFFLPRWTSKLVTLLSKNRTPSLLGSNFCIQKKWLYEVNGFDESFKSPGLGEDSDLERRLILRGLTLEWITYQAIQYHVWHPLTQVGDQSRNIFEKHKILNNKTALKGLKELKPAIEF